MSFAVLAVVVGVAILGPILAAPRRWHLPVVDVLGCHPERLAAARAHEAKRTKNWLHQTVDAMVDDVHDQWKRYRRVTR